MLSAKAIGAGLKTRYVGRHIAYAAEMGSTNDLAHTLAAQGEPEGTLVITDYQTEGRGRLDRTWVAPAGSSLLLSLIFRPSMAPAETTRLIMICGLAVLDAIRSETGIEAGLKWPNDIMAEEAKMGGILLESSLTGDKLDYVVAGIGLNVNFDPAALPADLLVPATSLSSLIGHPVSRRPLLWALLSAIEKRYGALKAGTPVVEQWAAKLVTLGEQVVVTTGEGKVEGMAQGVDADGALLVNVGENRVVRVVAGDVSLR